MKLFVKIVRQKITEQAYRFWGRNLPDELILGLFHGFNDK